MMKNSSVWLSTARFLCLALFASAGAFAQAPKEVIVVDGSIALTNDISNPSSVVVENDTQKPVPIIDVTEPATQHHSGYISTLEYTSSYLGAYLLEIPEDKLYQVRGVEVLVEGYHANLVGFCKLFLHSGGNTTGTNPLELYLESRVYPDVADDSIQLTASGQWDDLPPWYVPYAIPSPDVSNLFVQCNFARADGSPITKPGKMTVSHYGRLVELPFP